GACTRLAPAPCQTACPAGIDVPTYVTLIGQGKYAEAIEIIRRDNPFPWVCGLVCTRPCEYMCVRGRIDTPVSIKSMKAFAAERAFSEGNYANPPKAASNGRKVCIVGAGPAGMTCSYYLSLKGYDVTVIEAMPSAGGMMLTGIPRYRLPHEVIDREVAMLEDLGVKFRFNTVFDVDTTIDRLKKEEGFEAFFVAIGAQRCWDLNIPGEAEFTTIKAIHFLRDMALGIRRRPGRRVVIVGGGNVAIDAARSCVRLGCESVTVAYRRSRDEMPADIEEVEQAEEEGVTFEFLTIPKAIVGENGRITGFDCQRARLVAKEGGTRLSPVPIADSDFIIDCDMVIPAIGQRVDDDICPELKRTRRNTIEVASVSMETRTPGVFSAGDAVLGPATVVEAIGGGKRAAEGIDRYFNGIPQPKMPPVPVRRKRLGCIEVTAAAKMTLKRPEMPHLIPERRKTTFQQVELGLDEHAVKNEARRCLRCDICLRCGKCIAVCRDKMGIDALKLGYFDFDHPVKTDFRKIADRCIGCGACAMNCPNHAMTIKDKDGERILSLCGTILNRQPLVYCEQCGAVMGPRRYLDFVQKRVETVGNDIRVKRDICDNCLRKQSALSGAEIATSPKMEE
ncbi:MAG: FAD-dependent oxidoreductase, partial [Desulfosalsimonadaceae bacterium]